MEGGEGVVWALGAGGDLNANLVRFSAGRGVGEHVNGEVDVIIVGVSGSGCVEVDGEEHAPPFSLLVGVHLPTSPGRRPQSKTGRSRRGARR